MESWLLKFLVDQLIYFFGVLLWLRKGHASSLVGRGNIRAHLIINDLLSLCGRWDILPTICGLLRYGLICKFLNYGIFIIFLTIVRHFNLNLLIAIAVFIAVFINLLVDLIEYKVWR